MVDEQEYRAFEVQARTLSTKLSSLISSSLSSVRRAELTRAKIIIEVADAAVRDRIPFDIQALRNCATRLNEALDKLRPGLSKDRQNVGWHDVTSLTDDIFSLLPDESQDSAAARLTDREPLAISSEAGVGGFRISSSVERSESSQLRIERQLGDLQSKLAKIEQSQAALKLTEVQAALENAQAAALEAMSAADAAKKAAGEAAVASYASFYADRAAAHEAASKRWKWGTLAASAGVLGLGLIFVGFAVSGIRPPAESLVAEIEYLAARLLAVSALAAIAIWTSGQMAAHQHNAVVNRQKETAVNTFQAFAKEAPDQETKRLVVIEAAQTIYSQQNTGWGAADGTNQYQGPLFQVVNASEKAREIVAEISSAKTQP